MSRIPSLVAAIVGLTIAATSWAGDPPPVQPGDLLASIGIDNALLDVDPDTGGGAVRFGLGSLGPVTELVYGAGGTLYGTTGQGSSNLIVIDPDTGEETPVGEHDFGAVNGMELVGQTLYGAFFAPGGPARGGVVPTFLVVVDPETAQLSEIGEIEGFSPVRGLAYDPSSGVLYGAGAGLVGETFVDSLLLTIDTATGEGKVVGPIGYAVGAIRFGPDGVLYGGTVDGGAPLEQGEGDGGNLITIDLATGAGTLVGPTGFSGISGLAFVPVGTVPAGLQADPATLGSDGNGVFEPGELAEVAPEWRNDGTVPQSVTGIASDFTGPAGAVYGLVLDDADYGTLDPGQTASCLDTGLCYQMEVDDPAIRPATHWDATFDENLSDGNVNTWTLHLGDSFTDVARSSSFYSFIETLLHNGVTGGCSSTEYCPAGSNTRAQMPVFVLRALEGADYVPPACEEGSEVFGDVPFSHTFCPWIEELANRGVVSGCGGGNYCPGNPVTRGQMSIFLLKTLEGSEYTPPACTSVFADVACPSTFAGWIEELYDRGITGGCGNEPLRYCPANPVNRQQMAIFVTRTFGLTLYGP